MDPFHIDEFNVKVNISFDIFICSSSFEERCFSIPKKISENKLAKRTFIFENMDSVEYVDKNWIEIQKLFPDSHEKIEVHSTDPIKSADNISEKLSNIYNKESDAAVLIDITTFMHETLLILLAIMRRDYPKMKIYCCYINASEYAFDEPDQEKKWLSRGIKGDVRTILGYAGNAVPSKKTHLIVIVGYEHERAIQIIESMEADTISLGYGKSSDATTYKNKEANEQFARIVQKMTAFYDDIPAFTIPTNNPYKLRKTLLDQIEKIGNDYNIVVVPMNNKISTIGVALACQKNSDIQLCYAPARVYNYQFYSKVGQDCYFFSLDEKE